MSDNNDFYKCISKLETMYAKDPEKASFEAKALLSRLESDDKYKESGSSYNSGVLSDIGKDKLYFGVVIILMALIGLINLRSGEAEKIPLYYFGMIFFLAGFFFSLKAKGFGIIFLFSHGGTGFGLMAASLLVRNINMEVILDSSILLQSYFTAIVLLIISGFGYGVLYNLSDNLKAKKNSMLIPFVILLVALIMIAFLPDVMKFL